MGVNTKYTVFISSTYEDLKEERQEIVKACLKKGHIPIGMEMFSAGNESQWEVIQRTIEASDYYVLILAHRYGSTIESEGGISYTEKEYDYAIKVGVPVIGLVISKEAGWPDTKRETDRAKLDRLAAFKAKVQSRMVAFWTDKASLRIEFGDGFDGAQISHPRPGWIRSTQAASPQIANEIARLSEENERLRKQVESHKPEDSAVVDMTRIADELRAVAAKSLSPRQSLLFLLLKLGLRLDQGFSADEARDLVGAERADRLIADLDALSNWDVIEKNDPMIWSLRDHDVYSITGFGRQIIKWHTKMSHLRLARGEHAATQEDREMDLWANAPSAADEEEPRPPRPGKGKAAKRP